MRQKSLFFILFLSISQFAFSEVVNFFTPNPVFSIQSGVSFENGSDYPKGAGIFDVTTILDMKELVFTGGIRNQKEGFDFTTSAIYWPTFFNHFNFGVGTIFHAYYVDECFLENDFLIGLHAKYDTLSWFYVAANMMCMYKLSTIKIGDGDYLKLSNNNMGLALYLGFRPIRFLDISLGICTYSYYRYMLFFAPDYQLSVKYKISDMFSVGTELEIQYIDMFTLSANLNSVTVRCYLGVKI